VDTLTKEQQRAFDEISRFVLERKGQAFTVSGAAGTGKTHLLAAVAKQFPDAITCAPTGKAAFVLRQRTGLTANTIHHAFYKLRSASKDERGRTELRFTPQHRELALSGELVLVDESSMIDTAVGNDLLRTGAQIVAFGDPHQLPPVKGRQHFTNPDTTLTEIRRQALESPILRQAHRVRAGGDYEADTDKFRVVPEVPDADALDADVILCWRNSTRNFVNSEIRRLRGLHTPQPQVGERLLCLKSAPEFGVFNGGVYQLTRPFNEKSGSISLDVEGTETVVPRVTFEGVKSAVSEYNEPVSQFDFGYCLTAHKAQGSEFRSIIVVDEYPAHDPDRRRWVYTALTRASDSVIVVREE